MTGAVATRVPGYCKSLALDDPSGTVPGWVMVYAETFIAANKAADLVNVKWSSGKAASISEADIQKRAAELIADPKGGSLLVDDPGVDVRWLRRSRRLNEPTPRAPSCISR